MLQWDVLIHLCHGLLVEGQSLLFKHKIMTRYVSSPVSGGQRDVADLVFLIGKRPFNHIGAVVVFARGRSSFS